MRVTVQDRTLLCWRSKTHQILCSEQEPDAHVQVLRKPNAI
jgi:hypothetical protein